MRFRYDPLLCAIILVGAVARVGPMFHDFWLDEAWSYILVRDFVSTPVDILNTVHTDNNHPLNSLALYLLGPTVEWPVYRLPAWISGVLCVPLSFAVMRRFGDPHAIYAAALVACSYPLIVYSTEARGYGTMLCCLLLALYSLQRWLLAPRWTTCGVFWTAVILAALSHLTAIHGYLAMLVFSVNELRRRSATFAGGLADYAKLHTVPLLFLVAFYWVYVRHISVAGSAPTRLIGTLAATMTMALGGPASGPLAVLYVGAFLMLLFLGLDRMKNRSDGWHVLFAGGIVLVPLPLITLRLFLHPESTPIFPRYFLTSIILFLMLTGFLLGELHQRQRRGKIICGVLLALIIAGNFIHTARFTLTGRGQYLQALRQIVREGPERPIHVASNSDFRTSMLLAFYRTYLPNEPPIVYHSRQDLEPVPTIDWWIVEFLDSPLQPPPELETDRGRFSLVRYFDFYGPSGCGWGIYRRSRQAE
jgi:hypothetical protein